MVQIKMEGMWEERVLLLSVDGFSFAISRGQWGSSSGHKLDTWRERGQAGRETSLEAAAVT